MFVNHDNLRPSPQLNIINLVQKTIFTSFNFYTIQLKLLNVKTKKTPTLL